MSTQRLRGVLCVLFAVSGCGGRPVEQPQHAKSTAPVRSRAEAKRVTPECRAAFSHLFRRMQSPIEARLFVPTGHDALEQHSREVVALVTDVAALSRSRVVLEVVPVRNEAAREAAEAEGVKERELRSLTNEPTRRGFLGLVFKHADQVAIVEGIDGSGLRDGPYALALGLANLERKMKGQRKFAIITGKDELRLDEANLVPMHDIQQGRPSVKSVIEQAFPYYALETIDLGGGAVAIDPRHRAVLITQPKTPYTAAELHLLDDFLLLGGRTLVVFASAVQLRFQGAKATLAETGLEPLLAAYGIELRRDTLADPSSAFIVPVKTESGDVQEVRFATIVSARDDHDGVRQMAKLDGSFPPFWRVGEVAFPMPSSLGLLRGRQPADVSLRAVAQTTSFAYRTREARLLPQYGALPEPAAEGGAPAQHVIAALAEGRLASAFREPRSRALQPSRVLVIASGMYLTNPLAYVGNPTQDAAMQLLAKPYAQKYLTMTLVSVKNILDWSLDADDLRPCEPGRAWTRAAPHTGT